MNVKTLRVPLLDPVIASVSLYVSCQLIANVLSTKISVLPILHLAIDGGTIIYPLTFTLRDFVHKTLGKRLSRQVVIVAAAINVLAVILFVIVGKMPAEPSWLNQAAYEAILLPVWRITVASIVAQIVSELVDTEVFSRTMKKFGDVRGVLASNSVALVADTILFSTIAFLGALPNSVVVGIMISNLIIKMVISLVSSPIIKLIHRQVSLEEI